MFFYDLSEFDARRYRDHVVARGPARLQDLAFHLAETGGPVGEMDASLASLIPLWEWYLERFKAGLPEIPYGSQPSRSRMLRWNMGDGIGGQATYATEPFSHYLFEIVRRYAADARWDLFPHRSDDDGDRNSTAVLSSLQYAIGAEEIMYNIATNLMQGRAAVQHPRGLLDRVLMLVAFEGNNPLSESEGSVLRHLLETPRIPLESPVRIPPTIRATAYAEQHERKPFSGEYFLGPTNLRSAGEAARLDVSAITDALREMGAHRDGETLTTELMRQDEMQFVYGESLVSLETQVHGGELQAIVIEPVQLTDSEWQRFVEEMDGLAQRMNLRFGTWQQFD